ncbi:MULTISPECIES: LPS export ABC transporter permease LptG [Haemophilus]|jgi:lipopolysaccharide export system permease protein lptG|uniref:LPS export ABC transporter permease LptG n=2 Tax=Haemophilus TaxID=724 RepID=A0A502LN91_HAEHA|nr:MULTISPECIES: LPS export ABC transporter permease LptG [Haemophilus]KAA5522534.1 LPS export ABC transporter permease LptG [Haemophilus seminalis]KKZ54672.1 lipopolysaccharide ABC transporter permease [Haemophilus haemolyticus]NYA27541.1 LPS export ABC transporter permease LptG [Haemophilus haemolyticus]TPH01729.1 lipopolysaccharide ABC transporter permease LptG [Haemophilus haemolyticus]TPH25546.1 lipopolysaccharide ABC transporter permease LptG [Haemophilus haemolyticus]
MMNTLDRYIGKSILGSIFATLLTLVGLSAIIKFVEQFRSVGKGTYDIWQAVAFTGLTIPKDIETFFPMAALLGALMALGNLASRSELVVMQAAGFSRFKIGMAVMKTALPLVLLTMVIGEWGIPQTEQFARDMRARALSGGSMLSMKNGVWAKDGNNFVFVRRVTDDAKLNDIYIYTFDQHRNLTELKHANQASYSEDESKWTLRQVNHSMISKDEITTSNRLSEKWETNLTPDKLGAVSLRPTSLSISGLYNYISFLRETGQDVSRFELTFWRKIFQPVSVGVMMLLALSFIFGSLRSVTAGARIVTGICFGFLFYVVNEIFGQMSVVYNMPAVFGALMPSLLFIVMIWWLLSRKRD